VIIRLGNCWADTWTEYRSRRGFNTYIYHKPKLSQLILAPLNWARLSSLESNLYFFDDPRDLRDGCPVRHMFGLKFAACDERG
jgi:hypothetical protein